MNCLNKGRDCVIKVWSPHDGVMLTELKGMFRSP